MDETGLSIRSLRATVDEEALLQRRLRVTLEEADLLLSQEALARLAPSDSPVRIDRLAAGRIYGTASFSVFTGVFEAIPGVTEAGRLRPEIVSVRAAGVIPVPLSVVLWGIHNFAGDRPGLYFGADGQPEIDLSELIGALAPSETAEVVLPPLREVRAGEGTLELVF